MTADLSPGTMQARTQWNDIFDIVKDDICKLRFLYPTKISAKNKGEILYFFFLQHTKGERIHHYKTTVTRTITGSVVLQD